MNITSQCVACIFHQAHRAAGLTGADEETTRKILEATAKLIPGFSFDHSPPWNAREVYEEIGRHTGLPDPIGRFKEESRKTAETYVPYVKSKIEASEDKLLAALKAALAGNVMDFGAKTQYDFAELIDRVFHEPLVIDHYFRFREALEKAPSILYLGDNTGEHLFDKVLIETIHALYPGKTIAYAVRGKPIINDVTFKEAEAAGIREVAELVDSGVDTPGLELERADPAFVHRFREAPMVIAKGMGNFECLEQGQWPHLFFLFKIKCDVVAAALGKPAGGLVLMNGAG